MIYAANLLLRILVLLMVVFMISTGGHLHQLVANVAILLAVPTSMTQRHPTTPTQTLIYPQAMMTQTQPNPQAMATRTQTPTLSQTLTMTIRHRPQGKAQS